MGVRPDVLLRSLAVALAALLGVGIGLSIHEATAEAIVSGDDEPLVEAAIVGGRPAELNPGTIRLEIANDDGQGWLCTGSLISPTAVLTAAHCVSPVSTILGVVAQVGSFLVDDPAMLSIAADRIDVHPTAQGLLGGSDVAVVHFAQPLPLEPVSLWTPSRQPAGLGSTEVTAETYGWGAVDPGGDIDADRLMAASTTILPDAACDGAWGVRYVSGAMMCTSGATPCFGDSGGPLLVDLGEGRLSVGGVVSYGSAQCGLAPTVYTSVASVLDWLREIVPDLTVSAPTPVAEPQPASISSGYWVLERSGVVHNFGAPDLDPGFLGDGAVAIEPVADGEGAWLLTPDGDVIAVGSAPDLGSVRGWLGAGESARALAGTPSGAGYWVVTDRGRVVPFGDAPAIGDVLGVQLNAGVIDATSSSTGRGLYLVGGDGGVFALGDAVFHGSMGGQPLNAPVVGLAPTPSGAGYWLVASDGGVFAFGDAGFRGSMGGVALNQPVGGMVPYGGDGYLLVASDGGVFVFSDAPFVGSLGDDPPPTPVVDVAPRPVAVG